MRLFILFLTFTFSSLLSFSQEKKGKLFFEASLAFGKIDFKPEANNDLHFKPYMDEFKNIGGLNLGIGWLYKNNLTLGLKTGFGLYTWDKKRYYNNLEESYIDTYVYPNYFADSALNLGNGGELVFCIEIGYLIKLNKITFKPNLEIGFLDGGLSETRYAIRSHTENLPTFVRSKPSNVRSIYYGASLDIGVPSWERLFLHLGYGYSAYDVDVQLSKLTPDGVWNTTIQKNKYQSQRLVVGIKFALLKR